ncbi:unnamed protein product [Caenorhabditis bovis]|uniref:Uncharacterized protein n=1 Tax=Caenorhabditis bovis TaxID=2654633 RepID=A0A8S1EMQ6_9PELO|nr:unnamed protein product [Caenorhabditis bovis]
MTVSAKLNHAVTNSQQDAFAIASSGGVKFFNTVPLSLLSSVDNEVTGNAKIVAILHRCNLICFVGTGKYPANTAIVYCTKRRRIVMEYTIPGGEIRNVLMSSTRIVFLQDKRIHIFSFPNRSKLIRSEEIRYNPTGLAAMSVDELFGQQLVFPGFKLGSIRLMNLNSVNEHESLSPCNIDAHKNEIAQLAINSQGTLLATGSILGTLIRIFDTRTLKPLTELRRGNVQAHLHTIVFSPCSSFLAAASDKGTVHIWGIRNANVSATNAMLKHVGIKGDRDIANLTIEPRVLTIAFHKGNSSSLQTLVIACADGSFHRYTFTTEGNVQRQAYDILTSPVNYLDKMAPINGLPDISTERIREAFRDEVSKRMGELLLKGHTMLDEYCQTCSGIIMEDRQQQRRCVTCELYAEKTNDGSRIAAQIPLDAEDLEEAAPGSITPKEALMDYSRSVDYDDYEEIAKKLNSDLRKPSTTKKAVFSKEFKSKKATNSAVTISIEAIQKKMKWASEELNNTTHLPLILDLIDVISKSAQALKSLQEL